MRPLLGLLSPAYLVDGGFREVLGEARDYGQELRRRLDLVLRQDVLPVLGRELGRCARADGRERDAADAASTALWDDIASLVKRMRTGHTAWELPAYNGDLFAASAVVGAAALEKTAIPDAALAPALVAGCRASAASTGPR